MPAGRPAAWAFGLVRRLPAVAGGELHAGQRRETATMSRGEWLAHICEYSLPCEHGQL
jgi:hypothetical protein